MTLVASDSSGNAHDLAYSSDNPAILEQCLDGHAATPSAFQGKGTSQRVIDPLGGSAWAYDSIQTFHLLFYGVSGGTYAELRAPSGNTQGWELHNDGGGGLVCFHRAAGFVGYHIAVAAAVGAGAWHLASVAISPNSSAAWFDGAATGGNGALPGYNIAYETYTRLTVGNKQAADVASTARIDEFVLEKGHYGTLAEHQSLYSQLGNLAGWDAAAAALAPTAWYRFADECAPGWQVGSVAF